MNAFLSAPVRLLIAALAVGGLMLPVVASAQPSYAQQSYASDDETIHGRINSIDGTFNITVNDDRGFVDNVELHQGTIINPTGLTLTPGMSVTIVGFANGSYFEANEIDTPYHYSGPQPVPVYYGAGWWYPGYAYGYGPSYCLTIVLFGGGYHYEHRRFEGHAWDGRGFSGRIFVAAHFDDGSHRYIRPIHRDNDRGWASTRHDDNRGGYTGSQHSDSRATGYTRTEPSIHRYVAPSDNTVRAYPSSSGSTRTYSEPARRHDTSTYNQQSEPARTYQSQPSRNYQTTRNTQSAPAHNDSHTDSRSRGDSGRNSSDSHASSSHNDSHSDSRDTHRDRHNGN